MDTRISEEVSITDLFDQFIEASTMRNVLSIHHRIMHYADINPCEFNTFFPKLKQAVMNRKRKNWKAKALFSKIDKKAAHRCYSNTKATTFNGNKLCDNQQVVDLQNNSQECLDESVLSQSNRTYNNNALQNYNCLIIGSGPAGLRTAIELQLLGASRVVVVEKRSRFSRNNVLHLWPFVIDDLKSLGAKKFYGKFCAGSIDHISIRQLQLILLKICLMIGCDFRESCSYLYLCPRSIKQEIRVTSPTSRNNSDISQANNGQSDNSNCVTICDIEKEQDINDIEFVRVSDQLNLDVDIRNTPDISLAKHESISMDSVKPFIIKSDNSPTRVGKLQGTRAHFHSDYDSQTKELHSIEWDVIIGADGRRNTLGKFFPRKEFRGRLAIAITANFINRQTPAEAAVSEISGLSYIYNQDMFNALAYDTNIQLENICYYKDDTHYFVMTAKKKSLLERGVLINDHATTQDLLSDHNVDRQALLNYAKDAARWTTGLEPLEFALNHYGLEDCAMFDFTSMYAASNACKALRTREGGFTLLGLVGDSLLEPFWPTGSGCARGFLSSFDAAWMCRQWAVNKCAVIDYHHSMSSRSSRNRSSAGGAVGDESKMIEPTTYNRMALSVMAERESIYRILAQTKSENLQQNYVHWTLNPHSRYPNLNRHLVAPTQVEHLITDNDSKNVLDTKRFGVTKEQGRRIKSPLNSGRSRKSPKKLKSADASPIAHPKNLKSRSKSLSKKLDEDTIDRTYRQLEESYINLIDDKNSGHHYLNFKRDVSDDLPDDLFVPSISGTLPSSNNLVSLEARRARDIDECLRLRRQRAQLSVVRDQLFSRLKDDLSKSDEKGGDVKLPRGAALFSELKRIREQQSRGKENWPRDVSGPLTLLNSIRRCTSFAERVKSFESKIGPSNPTEKAPSTPRTPVDTVKNLPEFVTLQELFVNKTAVKNESTKKPKLPVMKLSKDDWNVKCWERRLTAYRQKREQYGSSKSLNKAVSVDSYHNMDSKPEKQVEIFKDRIKEMAEKLQKTRDLASKQNTEVDRTTLGVGEANSSFIKPSGRPQGGWVSHLQKELIKGTEAKKPQDIARRPMNPVAPNQPIRKLFEDDDNDDDGIDVNKHYDHLCINRPTNKYLPRNSYTSHLTRTKYNSATSKVINREPSTASKQAYLNAISSRGSSSSSTLSDYSTNTGGSTSSGERQQQQVSETKCFRCKRVVEAADKISIGSSTLHRLCLTCGVCGITLKMNEIQHYLSRFTGNENDGDSCNFICAICNPSIRNDLTKEAADRLSHLETTWAENRQPSCGRKDDSLIQGDGPQINIISSREEFLSTKINYNELYKNILNDTVRSSETARKIGNLASSGSQGTKPIVNSPDSPSLSRNTNTTSVQAQRVTDSKSSPSPVTFTLPLNLDSDGPITHAAVVRESKQASPCRKDRIGYRVAQSETIDGKEQVTLILPGSMNEDGVAGCATEARTMIDEDEFQRRLHLNSSPSVEQGRHSSSHDDDDDERKADSDDDETDQLVAAPTTDGLPDDLSEVSSSLELPPDIDDDDLDEADDTGDQNSTYEDVLTSDEFGSPSDDDSEEGEIDNDVNAKRESVLRQVSTDMPSAQKSDSMATSS